MEDTNYKSILIKSFNVPILMNKNQLMTINNFSRVHWATKSKIKNEYKQLLSNWFMDGSKIPENSHIVWTPTYKDARIRDSINLASIAKIVEDVLVETNSLDNDNQTSHTFHPGSHDKTLSRHMLRVDIYSKQPVF